VGLSLASIGSLIDLYLILTRIIFNQWLNNRPLLIVGTMLIVVGVQLVIFGLLAEMIAFSYRREDDYSIVDMSDSPQESDAPSRSPAAADGPSAENSSQHADGPPRRSTGR